MSKDVNILELEREKIVARLRACVENSGMSYVELERRSNISKSSIQRYCSGATKRIPVDAIKAIAEATGVDYRDIIGWGTSPTIIKNLEPLPPMYKVPLLGTIACGLPILAQENIEDIINVPRYINADFALNCQGDSMINARINDGDIVYIRQQAQVEQGEIAAVLIDDSATLKRVYYYKDKNMLILKAENPKYDDQIYTNEELENVKILGKAVGFTSLIK